jgi:hypothetical protein
MRNLIFVAVVAAPLVAVAAAEPDRGIVVGRSQLPTPVEQTLAQEAGEHGLAQLRRVTDERGRVAYTAVIAGTDRTVEVAPDGTIRWRHSTAKR